MYIRLCFICTALFVTGSLTLDTTKIYNGDDATPHAYPWMAVIVSTTTNAPLCGGTLVSERHVLTAGHCMGTVSNKLLRVHLGDHDITESEGAEQIVAIKNYTIHPLYNGMIYDVALIELAKPARLKSDYIQTIDILRREKQHNKIVKSGKIATLSGWGWKKLYNGWRPSDILQTLDVAILDDDVCVERGNVRLSGFFCYEAARDVCSGSCVGDSGSPLVVKQKKEYVLIGFHNYRMDNKDGCTSGVRGATKAFEVADWIDSVIF